MENNFESKNIKIEKMEKKHIAEVALLEKEAFSIPWSEQSLRESMELEHTLFLVALYEKEVVGYIGMYKVFNEGDITNITVNKHFRNKGIGTMLIKKVLEKSLEYEIRDVLLEVRESNNNAIKLYEKIGFVNIGTRKNFYERPVENAMIMWKNNNIK